MWLLLLSKRAVLAHRFERPLAAEMDEYEQRHDSLARGDRRYRIEADPRATPVPRRLAQIARSSTHASPSLSSTARRKQQRRVIVSSVSGRPTVDDLGNAIEAVAEFLDRQSLPYVAEVRVARQEVARSDAHGARRYLDLNRALLDIYFSRVNGNAQDDQEAEQLQGEFEQLHNRAFTLAEMLLRASR